MPIDVCCPRCGKPMSAPDSAAGKKGRCKDCGTVFSIPRGDLARPPQQPVQRRQASPPAQVPPVYIDARVIQSREDAQAPTRRCDFCGEAIQPNAKKCRHCGEVLDVALRAAHEAQRAAERRRRDDDSDERPVVIIQNNVTSQAFAYARSSASQPSSCAGCLVIILATFLIAMVMSRGSHQNEPQAQPVAPAPAVAPVGPVPPAAAPPVGNAAPAVSANADSGAASVAEAAPAGPDEAQARRAAIDLNVAWNLDRSGKREVAITAYQAIVKNYPGTDQAAQAAKRLHDFER